jgi:hypothetical protein
MSKLSLLSKQVNALIFGSTKAYSIALQLSTSHMDLFDTLSCMRLTTLQFLVTLDDTKLSPASNLTFSGPRWMKKYGYTPAPARAVSATSPAPSSSLVNFSLFRFLNATGHQSLWT